MHLHALQKDLVYMKLVTWAYNLQANMSKSNVPHIWVILRDTDLVSLHSVWSSNSLLFLSAVLFTLWSKCEIVSRTFLLVHQNYMSRQHITALWTASAKILKVTYHCPIIGMYVNLCVGRCPSSISGYATNDCPPAIWGYITSWEMHLLAEHMLSARQASSHFVPTEIIIFASTLPLFSRKVIILSYS